MGLKMSVERRSMVVNNIKLEPVSKENLETFADNLKSIQPKAHTLEENKSKIVQPYILKHQLREQQLIGLEWLTALHDRKINGILADEMGLGKTMQTVALLSHLACNQGIWGPHLIIVPTTILTQWEMEIKKWCPVFKIVNQHGSIKERKAKRQGWCKPNAVHIVITSYKITLQDHKILKRNKFYQMILDEAHHIKNFKSQRWMNLLSFKVKRRLLLTGTPLQNNLMELWSLMHFLMPKIFHSHQDFKEWFSIPVTQAMNNDNLSDLDNHQLRSTIDKLHKILRPFVLRRMKIQVEKQLPPKYEHIVATRLSRRQRYLQDEFIHRESTQKELKKGDQIGILNILRQLRKVCNHPDLFDERAIVTPFECDTFEQEVPALVDILQPYNPLFSIQDSLNLTAYDYHESQLLLPRQKMAEIMNSQNDYYEPLIIFSGKSVNSQNDVKSKWIQKDSSCMQFSNVNSLILPSLLPPSSSYYYLPNFCSVVTCPNISAQFNKNQMAQLLHSEKQKPFLQHNHQLNNLNDQQVKKNIIYNNTKLPQQRDVDILSRRNVINQKPMQSWDLLRVCKIECYVDDLQTDRQRPSFRFWDLVMHKFWNRGISQEQNQEQKRLQALKESREWNNLSQQHFQVRVIDTIKSMIMTKSQVKSFFQPIINKFTIGTDRVLSRRPKIQHNDANKQNRHNQILQKLDKYGHPYLQEIKNFVSLPDKLLIQQDCGKLQALADLLNKIQKEKNKCLIFTQMSKMLDILEKFLNLHGYSYVRLDGSTKIDQRQYCVDKFNKDVNILCFISSTRSGGVGLNLTAASQVIFQDTDWNPAMDKQAQDRCHRIGQQKIVNIQRLISKLTVEENILKKSLQKRLLDEMVLKQGNFNVNSLFKKDELKSTQIGLEKVTFKDLACDDKVNIISREEFLNQPKEDFFNQIKEDEIQQESIETNTLEDDENKKILEELEVVEDQEDACLTKEVEHEIKEQEEQLEDDFEGENTIEARVDVEQQLTPLMLYAFNCMLEKVPRIELKPDDLKQKVHESSDEEEKIDLSNVNVKKNEIQFENQRKYQKDMQRMED